MPCSRATGAITSATAPVAAEIIAGRPPTTAIVTAIVKEANSPTCGGTPAMIEKEIASGIRARATTRPPSTSVLSRRGSRRALRTVSGRCWECWGASRSAGAEEVIGVLGGGVGPRRRGTAPRGARGKPSRYGRVRSGDSGGCVTGARGGASPVGRELPQAREELVRHRDLPLERRAALERGLLELPQLLPDGVRGARPGRGLRDLEQLAHLLEREVQRLHPTDQQDPFDIRLRVEPEAARGALRGGDQPDLVVVTQGAQTELGALGDRADVQQLRVLVRRGHGDSVPHRPRRAARCRAETGTLTARASDGSRGCSASPRCRRRSASASPAGA